MPDDEPQRPAEPYYEYRHDFLTQGDVFLDVPISQLGPELLKLEVPQEFEPIPEGVMPTLTYVWTTGYGMLLSNTCHFRKPRAEDILRDRAAYAEPGSVYHNGFLRVAPIFPLEDCPFIPRDEKVRGLLRARDHYHRFLYLPEIIDGNEGSHMPESVVALHMADLISLDLLRALPKVCQLTRVARQWLNYKLVYFDTGAISDYREFTPDMN